MVLQLPVEHVLVLRQVEQTETPQHHRQRRLFEFSLTKPQIDGVVTQAKFLVKKVNQRPGYRRLWITADNHAERMIEITLAVM